MSAKWGGPRAAPRGPVLAWQEGFGAANGLRRLREAQDLTLAQLAGRLGCTTAWLQRRQQGAVRMTYAEAEMIAAGLGTDYAGLLAAGGRALELSGGNA